MSDIPANDAIAIAIAIADAYLVPHELIDCRFGFACCCAESDAELRVFRHDDAEIALGAFAEAALAIVEEAEMRGIWGGLGRGCV